LAAVAKPPVSVRNIAIIHLLIDTGIRSSEICGIRLSHLSMTSKQIRIFGKGEVYRTVPFSALTSKLIWSVLRERDIDPENYPWEFLFVNSTGKNQGSQMVPKAIHMIVSKLCRKCGITDGKMGPHRLRHTFATEMVKNNAYQDVVQQLLGHSNPKMTQRYVTLAEHDLKTHHGKASPLNNMKPLTGKK
jgi:integrase/recombinase XerD